MSSKNTVTCLSDRDLREWWQQYGAATQAGFYRDVPRRAARAEMLRRGLVPDEHPGRGVKRPDGYAGLPGAVGRYLAFWGLDGRP